MADGRLFPFLPEGRKGQVALTELHMRAPTLRGGDGTADGAPGRLTWPGGAHNHPAIGWFPGRQPVRE